MPDNRFTVIQFSDAHLDPDDPASVAKFGAAVDAIERTDADVIIASGDVSEDGHLHEGMFERVKARFDALPAPVWYVPGNHDVGDKVGGPHPVREAYLTRWDATFGGDRFAIERGGWRLLGLNSQIVGSGLPREDEQYDWLIAQVRDAGAAGQQVAIFMHAPAFLHDPDEQFPRDATQNYWAFDPEPRQRFLDVVTRPHVKLIGTGHLHWRHQFTHAGLDWVWCPSTRIVVDDPVFPMGGGVLGLMRYTFNADAVTHELIELPNPAPPVHLSRNAVEIDGQTLTLAELVVDATLLRPDHAQVMEELWTTIRIHVVGPGADRIAEACRPGLVHLHEQATLAAVVNAVGPHHAVAISRSATSAAAVAIDVGGDVEIDTALACVGDPQRLVHVMR